MQFLLIWFYFDRALVYTLLIQTYIDKLPMFLPDAIQIGEADLLDILLCRGPF